MTRPPIADRDGGDGTRQLLGQLIGSVEGMQRAQEEQKRDAVRLAADQKRDQERTDDRLTGALASFRDAQAARDSANQEKQFQQTQVILQGVDQLKRQVIGLDEKANTLDEKADTQDKKTETLQAKVEELASSSGVIKRWERYIAVGIAGVAILWAAYGKEFIGHFFK